MRYSIIVPTLNPGELWVEWVKAVKMQSIPPSMVYVVDSGSSDDAVVQSVNAGFSVTRISLSEYNHGGTRQNALSLIDSDEYVVLMTQDAILSNTDSIKNLLQPFEDKNIGAVCGRQLPRAKSGPIEAHSRLSNYPDSSSVKTFEDRNTLGIKAAFLSNSFAAYRVSALNAVGGFPEDVIFGEDMYVAAKLLESGSNIAYAAEACVYHSHDYTMPQEFRRYFDMGVLHAREPWIREKFGTAEGAGVKFVISEFRYLFRRAFWKVPEVILRTTLRYLGFKLGLLENKLPKGVKSFFSMNSSYFR